MAGKTLFGVGGAGAGKDPPEGGTGDDLFGEEEPRGLYSGPTVVDDDKVEEGLKKLRALELQQPPGGSSGEVAQSVVDSTSSEPTRIADVMPSRRPTAVGRSASNASASELVAPPADNMRGTLFGHSIHLPDIGAPQSADDISSGGVRIIESGPTGPSQAAARPAQAHRTPTPQPYRPPSRPAPAPAPAPGPGRPVNDGFTVPRRDRVEAGAQGKDDIDTDTSLAPPTRGKLVLVVLVTAVALVVLAIAARAWVRDGNGGKGPDPATASAPPPAAPAPHPATENGPATGESQPGTPTTAASATAQAAGAPAATAPAATTPTAPAAAAATEATGSAVKAEDTDEPPSAGKASATSGRHHGASKSDQKTSSRRHGERAGAADAAKAASPSSSGAAPAAAGVGDTAAPSRPAGTEKKRGKDEDPDGTLPPSD